METFDDKLEVKISIHHAKTVSLILVIIIWRKNYEISILYIVNIPLLI